MPDVSSPQPCALRIDSGVSSIAGCLFRRGDRLREEQAMLAAVLRRHWSATAPWPGPLCSMPCPASPHGCSSCMLHQCTTD